MEPPQQRPALAGRPCTCKAPPLVGSLAQQQEQEQLLKNLTGCGWSHIRICQDQESDAWVASSLLQQSAMEWKQRLVSYFDDPTMFTQSSASGITFRESESGKPGTVEPKRSLEVQRLKVDTDNGASPGSQNKPNNNNSCHAVYEDLLGLTDVLHQVACAVRRACDLPPQIFLEESSSDTANAIDLMRVFFYDAVDRPDDAATSLSLGSNAHTDWGALTVVWQAPSNDCSTEDCLQTYCHAHQKWIPVMAPTPPTAPSLAYWDFVVHVGDLTSLSAGNALQRYCSQQQDQSAGYDSTDRDLGGSTTNPSNASSVTSPVSPSVVVWPSPCHRVVSPTTQRRLSLVYFAYPPSTVSLQNMEEAMFWWWSRNLALTMNSNHHPNISNIQVPFDDYFILKNQSTSDGDDELGDHPGKDHARSVYRAIVNQPIRQVLQEKWQQVQR